MGYRISQSIQVRRPFLLLLFLRQRPGSGNWCLSFRLSGLKRTGWQGDWFGLVLEWVSRVNPAPDGPSLSAGRTRQGSRSRLCVKGRVVRRGEAAPSGETWIPPSTLCSLSPSPAAFWRPPHGQAGHVGASVTPSLTLLHTRARTPACCISWSFPGGHTGARESLRARPQGSYPLRPTSRPARSKKLSLSRQLLRGLHHSPLDRTFCQCCHCRDVGAAGGAAQTR